MPGYGRTWYEMGYREETIRIARMLFEKQKDFPKELTDEMIREIVPSLTADELDDLEECVKTIESMRHIDPVNSVSAISRDSLVQLLSEGMDVYFLMEVYPELDGRMLQKLLEDVEKQKQMELLRQEIIEETTRRVNIQNAESFLILGGGTNLNMIREAIPGLTEEDIAGIIRRTKDRIKERQYKNRSRSSLGQRLVDDIRRKVNMEQAESFLRNGCDEDIVRRAMPVLTEEDMTEVLERAKRAKATEKE